MYSGGVWEGRGVCRVEEMGLFALLKLKREKL